MAAPAPSASPYSPLEILPLLVLESVCEYLATSDSRRRSLFAFSMTSKRCCAVADRERFERIRLAVQDGQQLERILTRWDEILRVGGRSRYVRRVKITGRMSFEGEDPTQALRAEQFLAEYNSDHDDDEEDTFPRPMPLANFVGSDPVITQETKARNNRLWRPLAQFLSKCPGLKHSIWASTDQVPRCVLDILHSQLPTSRLHVNTFSLRSLYQCRDKLHDIDADEYALATSPSLSSICVAPMYYDSEGNADYNEEAVFQMMMGSAPNLQSVCMWYKPGWSLTLQDAMLSSRPPWRGFFGDKEDGSRKSQGHLTKLVLSGECSISPQLLQSWSRHTDFSRLFYLDLRIAYVSDALRALLNMAEEGVFRSLRTLSLESSFDNDTFGMLYTQPHPESVEAVPTTLLSALRPLEALNIRSQINEEAMSSILDHHGTSLKRLHLCSQLSDKNVEDVRNGCPNLRDLQLIVKRKQGTEQEVRLYQALGSFPRLERLTLLLDCEDGEVGEAGSKELTQYMCSALINSALDAHLAQSIFYVVFAANRAVRPEIAPSFQYLKLRRLISRHIGEFENLLKWVGRGWLCERERADAHSEEAIVREIRVPERQLIEEEIANYIEEDFEYFDEGSLYMPAWEAVWPEAKGKIYWIDEWHSFPLWQDPSIPT